MFSINQTINPETEGQQYYYCNDNETVEGPHTWEQLLELHGNGVISPATAICESGSEEWTTFGSYMLAEEQVLAAPSDDAAEFYEEAADPSAIQGPGPIANEQGFRMTPSRWAGVALAVILLAGALVYTNLRAPAANADEKPPVVVEIVLIGNPGNPPAICKNGEVGTVTYNYALSRHEITNEQYVAFLNSIAKDDKNSVFKENETSTKKWDYRSRLGPDGEDNSADIRSKSYILRTGEPGAYSYQVLPGFEKYPVFGVTWLDAARFANWMHNGQPKGPQAKNTTEDGAYHLENSSNSGDIPRRPEAKFWLPNWNEWFKAAYYNPALPGTNKYNEYATGSDEDIVNARFQGLAVSNPGPNTVAKGRKAAVGSCGNKSAYGVADMVGNAQPEWTDEEVRGRNELRGLASSDWDSSNNRDPISFGLIGASKYQAGIRLASKPTAAPAAAQTPPPTSTPTAIPSAEIQQLKGQADNGDVSAQYQLGIKYRDGVGVAKDQAQAIHYLQKSAEAGNVWGQVSLAGMYARGALRDATKHFYWIEKAAHNGDHFSMLVAALCHADGIGTPKNPDEADRLSSEVANKDPKKAVQAAAGVDWWMSALRKTGEPVSRARDLLSRSRADDTFQISVAGSQVMVNRMGRGPIGVVFFGHWRSREMKEGILSRAASFADLLPEKCSFFLWEYPQSPPFDQVQKAIQSYRQGDKEKIRPDFSGIAGQVLSQIRDKTGLTEFMLVGNSLGAGIVLWDYKNLSADQKVKFLLISPTEAFMPPIPSLGNLERTMLLSATGIEGNPSKTDHFLKGQEAWDWVNERIDRDATEKITASQPDGPRNFGVGHKTIGNDIDSDIDSDLLSKLIKVNLGLADRAMLAEPLPVVAAPLALPVKFDIGREAVELPAGTEVQVLRRERDKALIPIFYTSRA